MSDLFDHEAEAAVLGAVMMSAKALEAVIDSPLRVEDFHAPAAGRIYAAIQRCERRGAVDEALVVADLANRSLAGEDGKESMLDAVGGERFVRSLAERAPTTVNAGQYAAVVVSLAERRRLVEACNTIRDRAKAPEDLSVADLIAEASALVAGVESENRGGGFTTLDAEARRLLDEEWGLDERRPAGISSGFERFDSLVGGLRPGALYILAARPAMGKSAFLANTLDNIAQRGLNVALFSLEMGPSEVVSRIISRHAKIANKRLSYEQLSAADRHKVANTVADFEINHMGRFHISDAPGLSHAQIRSHSRKLDKELRAAGDGGLAAIGVDYMQLVTAPEMMGRNREQEVAKVSRELKALARELKLPVIALSQLSRALESRPDKRPVLADLRESGSIEQDADAVGFLYRHEYYQPDDPDWRGLAELILRKNRGGSLGTVNLGWRAAYTTFVGLEDVQRTSYVAGVGSVA